MLDYDKKSNTAEGSFIAKCYGILHDKEGDKLWDIPSENDDEGKKRTAEYLESRAL